MTARPSLPLVQPTPRMWQILRRCYRGQDPVTVLGRGLDMLAAADGEIGRLETVEIGEEYL